jgi:two-component system, LytTR family, response regulator
VTTPAIRTLVVDDEQLARERLVGFLSRVEDVALVGQAGDGIEALRLIEEHRPDVVFLDVQMPGMDGFAVLRSLRAPRPHVVFSTAFDEYAIRAFEVGAVDYLLKPYARARVEESLGRVRSRLARADDRPDWEGLIRKLDERRAPHVNHVPVHSGKRILIVPVADVLWFGVEYRLVYAHTVDRAYMTNYTLRELEERLDPAVFFRAHKSSLVNLEHVREIVPSPGGRHTLLLRDLGASEVALSRAQARRLRARLRW